MDSRTTPNIIPPPGGQAVARTGASSSMFPSTPRFLDSGGLLPAPVGHEVIAHVGKLLLLGSVGQHRPDLGVPADFTLEDDMTAVRSPARVIIGARVVGELHPALAGDVHDVDV